MAKILNKSSLPYPKWPLPNVWLGVSVENQQTANERIPLLLQTPAAVRWISAEPLLEEIDFLGCDSFTSQSLGEKSMLWPADLIHWVVAGGESQHGSRPSHPDWFRFLRDQCLAANVPFLFKQWGDWLPESEWEARGLDGVTDWWLMDSSGDLDAPDDRWPQEDHGEAAVVKIGKKKAGRELDGRIWDEYPEAKQ